MEADHFEKLRDLFLAQMDAAELAALRITRQRDQVGALREWAVALGKGDEFDRLKPKDVGAVLAATIEAAEGITRHVVDADHAMRNALDQAVKS